MATLTYPTGVDGFAVLSPATALTDTFVVQGSIGLGTGAPINQQAALGVVLQFTVVQGGTNELQLQFEVSRDGSNWHGIDEYDCNLPLTIGQDETFRLHIQPFTFGARMLRVSARGFASSSSPATLAIQARLHGLYEAVGGVS